MLKVITVTNNLGATQSLINSLDKFGWDYHIIECEWRGFGTKLIEVYRYLKDNPEVAEFIFCDAFDVVALGTPQEFLMKKQTYDIDAKLILSAERGLWPPTMEKYRDVYNKTNAGFDFINSGLYFASSDAFKLMCEIEPPKYSDDDQAWFHTFYHEGGYINTRLDTGQVLFNSHSFITENEYTYDNNRVGIMGNLPLFVHCNGRTSDPKLEEILKGMGL